jgi:hypothetical protein
MHKHRTPHGLEQHALIDRALLQLLLGDEHQRPWAEDELARAVSLPGDVRDGLRRLRASRLIHRWNDLATASRPAVRFHEITQGVDPHAAHERRDDRSVLEYLLADSAAGGAPLSDAQLYDTFSEDKRLAITDALGRLDGDGLIERRGGRVIASEVARRFDELMKL